MEECIDKILSVIRRHTSFGFIKMQEEQEIKDAIQSYVNSIILFEKEISYNEGYLSGVKTAHRMNTPN